MNNPVHHIAGGGFCYPNEKIKRAEGSHRLVLIAGGVGINPIVSITREIDKAGHSAKKVSLLFSAKSRDELIFRGDIEDICERRRDTFEASYFVTGDGGGNARARGDETGRVFYARIDASHLSVALGDDDVSGVFCYVCGPNSLTEDCVAALMKLGVPKENVFYELWW